MAATERRALSTNRLQGETGSVNQLRDYPHGGRPIQQRARSAPGSLSLRAQASGQRLLTYPWMLPWGTGQVMYRMARKTTHV